MTRGDVPLLRVSARTPLCSGFSPERWSRQRSIAKAPQHVRSTSCIKFTPHPKTARKPADDRCLPPCFVSTKPLRIFTHALRAKRDMRVD